MSQMSNFMENKIADFIRGQGLTLPGSWYFALGSAATDSSFTELTGTGYARVAISRALVNFAGTQGVGTTLASSGASHATSNNGAINWGNPGSAWGTANFVGMFDATSAGNCWAYFPITQIVITTGSPNPVQVDADALAFTLFLTTGPGGGSDYLTNKLIDLIWRFQAFTMPTPIYYSAFTVAPTSAGGGTEVGGGMNYSRVPLAPSLTSLSGTQSAGSTTASSGTGGRIANNAAITFPTQSGNWGDIAAGGVHDAATTGNLLFFGSYGSPISIVNGGPVLRYPANAFGLSMA